MRQIDDYIPVELWHEAKQFVEDVKDDVDIYHNAGKVANLKQCIEADKFCAYWSMESYEKFPHALITLYENKPLIDEKYDINDIVNPFELLQLRFKAYYLLLKEKGMIDD